MALEERQQCMQRIEELRGRTCIVVFNFDRVSYPRQRDTLDTSLDPDIKEPLYRVLKESDTQNGVDLFFYTRGGSVDAVWPIVSLLREFDQNFQVLIPYGCHSAGTMVTLGASCIILGPISELSPIDPTSGNAFNPIDPVNKMERMGISVEDVNAYREFVLRQLNHDPDSVGDVERAAIGAFLQPLTGQVHPLALGNVHRVFQQGRKLAEALLKLNDVADLDVDKVVDELSSKFFSHLHMINRHEARRILGSRVEFASDELANAMDALLREYEGNFALRRTFVVNEFLGADIEKEARFIGGAVECRNWSYLHETRTRIRRRPDIPPNIHVQLQPGQDLANVQGLSKRVEFELMGREWVRNTAPQGITV